MIAPRHMSGSTCSAQRLNTQDFVVSTERLSALGRGRCSRRADRLLHGPWASKPLPALSSRGDSSAAAAMGEAFVAPIQIVFLPGRPCTAADCRGLHDLYS